MNILFEGLKQGSRNRGKNAKFDKNLELLKEEMMEQNFRNEIDEEEKVEDVLDELREQKSFKTKSDCRRVSLKEAARAQEKIIKQLCCNFLTEMTIQSLVLDEKFKQVNKHVLRESLSEFYGEIYEDGMITHETISKTSPVMSYVSKDIQTISEELVKIKDKVGLEKMLESEGMFDILYESDKVTQVADEVSDIVKEKVVEVLEKEKEISANNKEEETDPTIDEPEEETEDTVDEENTEEVNVEEDDIEETDVDEENNEPEEETEIESDTSTNTITISTDKEVIQITKKDNNGEETLSENLNLIGSFRFKEYKNKSLFRNLLESNIRGYVLNENFNNRINMDLMLSESIVHYTILEVMNTTKLLPMNRRISESMSLRLKLDNDKYAYK